MIYDLCPQHIFDSYPICIYKSFIHKVQHDAFYGKKTSLVLPIDFNHSIPISHMHTHTHNLVISFCLHFFHNALHPELL